MRYRYNTLTTFHKDGEKIIISNGKYQISVGYQESIYNLLKTLAKQVFFNWEKIESSFNVSKDFLYLLEELEIIGEIKKKNIGLEASSFDSIVSNPSRITQTLRREQLQEIYKDLSKDFYNTLNLENTQTSKYQGGELHFQFNHQDLNGLHSTRKKKEASNAYKQIDYPTFQQITQFIFSLKNKGQQPFSGIYGSGGGFYSVFPVIITNAKKIIVYNKYDNQFHTQPLPTTFKQYLESCVITSTANTDFYTYNYHILLCAATKKLFNKYGNKGYKFIQIESGSIGLLYRILSSKFQTPYLEFQGFKAEQIKKLLLSAGLVKKTRNFFVCHSLFLS